VIRDGDNRAAKQPVSGPKGSVQTGAPEGGGNECELTPFACEATEMKYFRRSERGGAVQLTSRSALRGGREANGMAWMLPRKPHQREATFGS